MGDKRAFTRSSVKFSNNYILIVVVFPLQHSFIIVSSLTSSSSAERIAGVDESPALQESGGALNAGVFKLDLMIVDLCVSYRLALNQNVVVLVEDRLLLSRLR